jgi:hypothetical protein
MLQTRAVEPGRSGAVEVLEGLRVHDVKLEFVEYFDEEVCPD